ncbi:hypothetical protein Q0590_30750 [Rhodocytophaga aerolata]|uniref:EF-hand domain-containing protein n=1 Tax=Rhodocytophaga aerolata TaxID=455078 RepID=A0ABT8RF17_9BACT|nr:hypothetical protein [Rhodocytophaga aerolata]MDO1450693.1 hypothetical protein [Rhodocytophaga aerolata]
MNTNKKNKWNILKASAGILLILNLSACQVGSEGYGYTDWDANDNEMIERNEFNTTLSERYDEWDLNDDNFLDENEFTSFNDNEDYYSDWDADGDNRINETEFSDGLFSEWDGNADGYLEENEYNENYDTFFGV